MKFWEVVLARLKSFKLSSKKNPQLMLSPAAEIEVVEVIDKVIKMTKKSKSELRDEIQKRINGIAKAENGVDRVVIVDDSGNPEFVSGGGKDNNEDIIVSKSILFASRASTLIEQESESDFNNYDSNIKEDDKDLGEVEIIIKKRTKSVFSIVPSKNPDFSIVFYGKLLPVRFGSHNTTVKNDSPKIVELYKEMRKTDYEL